MLYKNVSSKGPEISIRFETAEGIIEGKTEIRCRSVTVGRVTRVELAKDLKSVEVLCTINVGNEHLLRGKTRFWVVRPRVSAADISGLGTFLTGAYIELDPGPGLAGFTNYEGLEEPPATSSSVPGLRLTLISEEAGLLGVGSPVYYRGYEVGRVEGRKLDSDGRRVLYDIFIGAEYEGLVRENTNFWNTSGIDIQAGVDGFRVKTPSLQSMVTGGVSFAVPEGMQMGDVVKNGKTFVLHADEDQAASSTFEPTLRLLLLFDQSVRGLVKDAPVEYRGIVIGRVANISFDYVPDRENLKIPVLVEVDPKLLRASEFTDVGEEEIPLLGDAIRKGLRATLKTGSFLTGAQYVDFDYYPVAEMMDLTYKGDFPVVPTLPSGFAQLEVNLTAILDKIEALPLEEAVTQIAKAAEETAVTVAEAKATLKEIEKVSAAVRKVMEDEDVLELPGDVRRTLAELEKTLESVGPDGAMQGDLLRTMDELRSAMRSLEAMTDEIKEKPNSLLFGKDESKDPRPRGAGDKR
jgi:paraquat-inducible protein B